ncbi:hypothetical protein [Mycolicibacterium poriferae]|uniref:hypothetical protein n=1 Tax=Mycolicibacterium poriferae TaxID=39694 RepID=UPI0015D363E8|nr:hypothetical protein [Mycolicibacterium poriferae]MCV7264045.1 hypothetical protein [Mycolicibacterium poriferae]
MDIDGDHRSASANGETERFAAAELSEAALFGAIPWRTFRWYKGQRHCSWCYWAATEDNTVIYESLNRPGESGDFLI